MQYHPRMRRRLVIAVWIVGATVPLLVASVFLVGCCVLPFHGVLHKMMPLCSLATAAAHRAADPSTPAREKEQPIRRMASEAAPSFRLDLQARARPSFKPASATAYRSFITLGAVRCDRDVGLHLIDSTFLI